FARALGGLLGDQRDGAVEPDREHVVARLQVGVGLAVLHVGAETPDAGNDRHAVLRVLAHFARQREQAERTGQIDVLGRKALWHRRSLGLCGLAALILGRLAELDVGPEPARAQRDFEARRRILAELLHAAIRRALTGRGRELARVTAFGIIRAA